jgi:hypothetical protein
VNTFAESHRDSINQPGIVQLPRVVQPKQIQPQRVCKRHPDGFLPFAEMSKSHGAWMEPAIRDGAKFNRGSFDRRK